MVESVARAQAGVTGAAFMIHREQPWLAVTGSLTPAGRAALEARFPGLRIRTLSSLPLDRRHNSKIDYGTLVRRLG